VTHAVAVASLLVALVTFTTAPSAYRGKIKPGWRKTTYKYKVAPPKPVEKPLWPEERDLLAYEGALKECAVSGNGRRAEQLLGIMAVRGVQRRRLAWTDAVQACAKAGMWDKATGLLDSMRLAGARPDHAAYNAAIEACEEQGMAFQAAKLLRTMRKEGFPPNVVSYTKVISMLASEGHSSAAAKLLSQAQAQGILDVWTTAGRFLDCQEIPTEVTEVVVRQAVQKRAWELRYRKAGKGGFYVLTGFATRSTAQKQNAVLRILREEFGLKVRVDPVQLGRCHVKGDELKALGKEWELAGTGPVIGRR